MQEFLSYFSRLTQVTEALRRALTSKTTLIEVNKGDYLHQAGKICNKTYWIKSGLLRSFYLKEGKEITDDFAAENEFITSPKSFMSKEPDQHYIQAIENAALYAISAQDLDELFESFPEMERFGRITMSIFYVKLSERLESVQFTSAKDKYTHFCKTYRPLLNRLPLGMIASYLGISQETLSRVRKQI